MTLFIIYTIMCFFIVGGLVTDKDIENPNTVFDKVLGHKGDIKVKTLLYYGLLWPGLVMMLLMALFVRAVLILLSRYVEILNKTIIKRDSK